MAKNDAEKEDDKSVNESELVDAFNVFWSKDGDRLPVEEWKNVVTPEAKTVVSFLKSNRSPGPKLMVCQAYKNCKEKWQNSKEKDSATSEEDFQHDENCVNWSEIKNPGGVSYFVSIRNWPMGMLCEAYKHTRSFVLKLFDVHPIKGVAMIMDKAKEKLGEIQKERDEIQKEKQEKKAEKEARKEQGPEESKKGVDFYFFAKKEAKNESGKMREGNENSMKNKRQAENEVGLDINKNIELETKNKSNATELE